MEQHLRGEGGRSSVLSVGQRNRPGTTGGAYGEPSGGKERDDRQNTEPLQPGPEAGNKTNLAVLKDQDMHQMDQIPEDKRDDKGNFLEGSDQPNSRWPRAVYANNASNAKQEPTEDQASSDRRFLAKVDKIISKCGAVDNLEDIKAILG